jgi:hypothetical protein
MKMKVPLLRLAALVALLAFAGACTKTIREDPDLLMQQGHAPDHMSILTTDGRVIESRKASVTDSTIVVEFVFKDGMQRRAEPPIVIPRSEIAVITRDDFDRDLMVGVIAVGLLLGIFGTLYL